MVEGPVGKEGEAIINIQYNLIQDIRRTTNRRVSLD